MRTSAKKKKKNLEKRNKHSLLPESLMLLTKCYCLYIKINEDKISILISETQNWFSSSGWVSSIIGTLSFLTCDGIIVMSSLENWKVFFSRAESPTCNWTLKFGPHWHHILINWAENSGLTYDTQCCLSFLMPQKEQDDGFKLSKI